MAHGTKDAQKLVGFAVEHPRFGGSSCNSNGEAPSTSFHVVISGRSPFDVWRFPRGTSLELRAL